jgi:hypothetical protein
LGHGICEIAWQGTEKVFISKANPGNFPGLSAYIVVGKKIIHKLLLPLRKETSGNEIETDKPP